MFMYTPYQETRQGHDRRTEDSRWKITIAVMKEKKKEAPRKSGK